MDRGSICKSSMVSLESIEYLTHLHVQIPCDTVSQVHVVLLINRRLKMTEVWTYYKSRLGTVLSTASSASSYNTGCYLIKHLIVLGVIINKEHHGS